MKLRKHKKGWRAEEPIGTKKIVRELSPRLVDLLAPWQEPRYAPWGCCNQPLFPGALKFIWNSSHRKARRVYCALTGVPGAYDIWTYWYCSDLPPSERYTRVTVSPDEAILLPPEFVEFMDEHFKREDV